MKTFVWIVLGFLPCLTVGCATVYVPVSVSSTNLGTKEKAVGTAGGTGDSLQEAVKAAIGTTGADTLINVFVENEYRCPLALFCVPTGKTRVFGTLIKYEYSSMNPSLFGSSSKN